MGAFLLKWCPGGGVAITFSSLDSTFVLNEKSGASGFLANTVIDKKVVKNTRVNLVRFLEFTIF